MPPAPEENPDEPCMGCPCCAKWTIALEILRNHAQRHIASEIRFAPCFEDCLLCAEVDWQSRVTGG